MAVAAAEVVVGLGLIVALARRGAPLDVDRAAEPARMNASSYGWLVLLTPLLGLAFNIAIGLERLEPRSSTRVASLSILAGLRASRCSR